MASYHQHLFLLNSSDHTVFEELENLNETDAIQGFDACYKQVSKFSLLLSVTHALLRFAAFFIKPLKPLSTAAKAHSEIGNKMQAFREALTKPIGFFDRPEAESVEIYQNKAKTGKPKRQVMK